MSALENFVQDVQQKMNVLLIQTVQIRCKQRIWKELCVFLAKWWDVKDVKQWIDAKNVQLLMRNQMQWEMPVLDVMNLVNIVKEMTSVSNV